MLLLFFVIKRNIYVFNNIRIFLNKTKNSILTLYKMIARSILFVTIVVAFISKTTLAFSSGAAGCTGDEVVAGPHVDTSKDIQRPSWAESKLTLKINGKEVKNGATVTVTDNAKNTIELSSVEAFKGFLFRFTVEAEYEGMKVIPSAAASNAENCRGIRYGLTHNEGGLKKKAIGAFSMAGVPTEITELKVVVVFKNADDGARSTFSDYTIKVVPAKPCVPKSCTRVQNFFGCTTKFCD